MPKRKRETSNSSKSKEIELNSLPTPSFLVHYDKCKNNCTKMIEFAQKMGVKLMPHMKTHKTLEIGLCQVYGTFDADEIVNLKNIYYFLCLFSICSCLFLKIQKVDDSKEIVVSTLGEARFYANSGFFQSILYAIPISPNKFEAASKLSKQIKKFSVLVDNLVTLNALSEFAKQKKLKFNVYLKIDGTKKKKIKITINK